MYVPSPLLLPIDALSGHCSYLHGHSYHTYVRGATFLYPMPDE